MDDLSVVNRFLTVMGMVAGMGADFLLHPLRVRFWWGQVQLPNTFAPKESPHSPHGSHPSEPARNRAAHALLLVLPSRHRSPRSTVSPKVTAIDPIAILKVRDELTIGNRNEIRELIYGPEFGLLIHEVLLSDRLVKQRRITATS
ncbi:hypothetical protein MPTK2_4g06690 [Marchantia polymorpha subsp. ruderalis]